MADKVNLAEKLASFSDHWAPRIVARYNDNEVRLVKVEGEFIWHQHDETDELFQQARQADPTNRRAVLLYEPTGSELHRSRNRVDHPSRTSGIATSSTRSSPAITRAGSRCW